MYKGVSYSLNDLYSLAGRIELIMKIKTQNSLFLETHHEDDNYFQAKQLMYIVGNYENQKAAQNALSHLLDTKSIQSQNFKNRLVNGKNQLYISIPQFLEYLLPHIRSTFAEHLRTTIRQQDGLVSSGSVLAVNQTLQNASENNAALPEVQHAIQAVQGEVEDQVVAERPEIFNHPIPITTSRNRLSLPTSEHPPWVCEIFKALNITRGLNSPKPSSQNILYLIGSTAINDNLNSTLSQLKADFPNNNTMSQGTDLVQNIVLKFGKSSRGQSRLESYKNYISILCLTDVDPQVQDIWEVCIKNFASSKQFQIRFEYIDLIKVFESMFSGNDCLETVISSFLRVLIPDCIETLLKIHHQWSGKIYMFNQLITLEHMTPLDALVRLIPSPIGKPLITNHEDNRIRYLEREVLLKKEMLDNEVKSKKEIMKNKKEFFDELLLSGFTKKEALQFMLEK